MDRIWIKGGQPLHGSLTIGGAKNAALPLMAAALLTEETLILRNLPRLADITTMADLLGELGVEGIFRTGTNGHSGSSLIEMRAANVRTVTAPYDLVRKMRASVLVLGPLLARIGMARVSLPGGCAIGNRPVDLHLLGLRALGAEIELKDGYVEARAPNGLKGARIDLPVPSVGATENIMLAASLAKGTTELANAAREPEIVDLGRCLAAMGATVEGTGTDTIRIVGAQALHGTTHDIIPDRIEAGSYALAAAITGGAITLERADIGQLGAAAAAMRSTGLSLEQAGKDIEVSCKTNRPHPINVTTEPFPGFPTDMQAQMMALMTIADGAAMITETIFENRFMHVPELSRMGADITVHGSSAMVRGVSRLRAAPVMATDLRASMSLVLAALAAEGESTINRVYHLDRGYERLVEKLQGCGAKIDRMK
ncbi:MAG: UDP-N-acetylglucosamine 1-carboxyvinyltransferase [Rhodospirillaceae bacterium]|nr:UDP-N-acetylglucosamine 1-carboxyvinyltransferase [Rhodospirillaceae bacterium]